MGPPGIILLQEFKKHNEHLEVVLTEAGLTLADWEICRSNLAANLSLNSGRKARLADISQSIVLFNTTIYAKGNFSQPLQVLKPFYGQKRFSLAKLVVRNNNKLQFVATSMHGFYVHLPLIKLPRYLDPAFKMLTRQELCRTFINLVSLRVLYVAALPLCSIM